MTHSETPPFLCELCGRIAALEWHEMGHDIDDVHECSSTHGVGWWLCSDACHPSAHTLMAADGQPGRSARAVTHMVSRLTSAVAGGSRMYRRREQ